MTVPPRDFYDDVERRSGHFRERAFDYDKLAAAYSQKGFETLTYLNGGALVALPAALAFFKTDIPKIGIILTGGAFIIGLLLVVLAQIMAIFAMAKRGESQALRYDEHINRVAAVTHPDRLADAERYFAASELRRIASNQLRIVGLVFFVLSLIAFVIGCSFGALAVVTAKDKVEVVTPKP